MSKNSSDRTILGIDLGTTSVKVVIVKNQKVLTTFSKETEASLDSPSEQDVIKIILTLEICLSSLPANLLASVDHIGVCGQMHGVCLWKSNQPSDFFENYDPNNVSNLYTWMDQRCDPEFLASLPVPDSHLRLSSGHGCATLFWLSKNSPEILNNYDSSGTVMDFLVAKLCGLKKPVMSDQNAASWGYFNSEKKCWNLEIMGNAGFPIHLLPNISDVDSKVVGKLSSEYLGIKAGTPIGPALGDLQSSVYSTLLDKDSGFINMSTSAQIVYRSSNLPNTINSKLEYFPYFGNEYLAVGASLNGGNVLQAFVNSIIKFAEGLDITLTKDFVWTKILAAAQTVPETDLVVTPTLFGERHDPSGTASLSNISVLNTSIGHVTRGLIKGLVNNLNDFVGVRDLRDKGIKKITAGGSALLRNLILKEELKRAFSEFEVNFTESDSAVGAALYFED